MSEKRLLFSVTKKDLRIDKFRAGGKGGSNQNKTSSGVRITHIPSGAVGEGRDQRQQLDNQRAAFKRMIATSTFQTWLKKETAIHLGIEQRVEEEVKRMMEEKNLRIEVRQDGTWIKEPDNTKEG